ncbi:two-component system nitrate/nitrite response regulator NarL [Sphingomonas zeicaulis]|uniref:LuxR C-terminal-related transcriptional regulator n=1 Tax=Sphingomonas zeicaulis TaxID=1632740 RepID=UPI003D1A8802
MREGLRRLMSDDCGHVETCAGPHDLSGTAPQGENIILISDLFVPHGEYHALDTLRERRPDAKIVVMGSSSDPQHISKIFKAGAAGYVSGNSAFRALRSQLDLVALGERVYPAALIEHVSRDIPAKPPHDPWPGLTTRERSVLDGLILGLPNKSISRRLEVSEATVKLALKTLFRKMQARNRTHAAVLAREHGWNARDRDRDQLH